MIQNARRTALIAAMALIGAMACDEVTTDLTEENTAPTASATTSAASVVVGADASVDGSGSSDADGDDLTFSWSFASVPAGSGATLSGADTQQATFTTDATGEYVVMLTVSDGEENDSATVSVVAQNTAPVAAAEPDTTVAIGSTVDLDGSGSGDPDASHTLTFSWSLESPATSGATLSDPGAESPSFTADVEGEYLAILTVTDGFAEAVDTAEVIAVEPGDPPSIVEAGTEGDIAFGIGHTVYVVATDPDGNALSYAWSLVDGPGELSFPDANFDTDTTNIAVDVEGSYLVEVAVSDGFNTVADTLSFEAHDPLMDSNITADETLWPLLNAPYTVTREVNIEAAVTIEPGAVFEFDADAGFDVVGTSGSLTAAGTQTDTIRFLGGTATAGHWRGIRFRTNNPANELAYVEIAHAGSTDFCCTGVNSNVYVEGSAQASISNALIRGSGDIGLAAENGAALTTFSDNHFSGNSGQGVQVGAQVVGMLDAATVYDDAAAPNGEAYIGVWSANVGQAATWPAPDAPFLFDGETNIQAAVTIDPGAEFWFTAGAGLDVNEGSLAAVGSEAAPIVFRGENAVPGHWLGLRFQTNNPANELTYVEVSHGGSTDFCCTGVLANVHIDGTAQISISHSSFRQSGRHGLYIDNAATVNTFGSNHFAANTDAGLTAGAGIVGSLDTLTVYNDAEDPNGEEYIGVFARDITADATWPATHSPYAFSGETNVNAAVTIDPGAVLWFEAGAGIDVAEGSLAAVGTASDTIRFLGEIQTPGHWKGLRFQTNDPANELTYVEVAHGGSTDFCCTGINANVHLDGVARVAIDNSSFRESDDVGLYVEASATITSFASNHFGGNTGAGAKLAVNQLASLDAATVYNDGADPNGDAFIDVFAGTASDAGTWAAPATPYRFTGESNLEAEITIAPGADLMFAAGAGLDVTGNDGALIAVGESGARIVFRGEVETQGYWKGLRIRTNNPLNELNYVTVTGGGSTDFCCTGVLANVHVQGPGALVLANSIFDLSADWDVYKDSDATIDDSAGNNQYNSGGKNF